nr:hypothetical protein [Tanacetum cinerariifolium]
MSRSPKRINVFSKIQRDRSTSSRCRQGDKRRRERDVFHRLGVEEEVCPHTHKAAIKVPVHEERSRYQKVETVKGDSGSQSRENKSQVSKKKICLNHGHARKQIPSPLEYATLNSQKRAESIYHQQKKCIKDPVEIHHIKQREGKSVEDFMQIFKAKSRHVKGSPECMRIFEFMHGITNPELIKRLHVNISKLVDEMMKITIVFLQGEMTASNQARKKAPPVWKQQDVGRKQNFDRRGDFRDKDGTEGPMIIEAEIRGHFVHRIYVDGGLALEILCENCFNRLRPEVKSQMILATAPLIGFSGKIIWPMGQILLPVKIGDAEHFTSIWMNFVSSRIIPLECTMVSGPKARPSDIIQAAEERIKVAIHPEHLEQTIIIGSTLTEEGRKALCDLLRRGLGVFAWKSADMIGVSRHIAEHRLNVREGCSLNDKATYQRLVDKAFQKQIGRILEVYVDDLVIKSRTEHEIIRDIQNPEGNKHETKPKEMHIRNRGKHVPEKCTESDFQWTAKVEIAFKEMKKLIVKLPTLTAPMEKEELIVHLAAAREAVSAVLMTEREAKKMSVYFVSRALQGPEINYILMEKTSVKGHILVDFIVECPKDNSLDTPVETKEELSDLWTLFTEGSSCINGFEASLILTNPEGAKFTYALRFRFDATNNEAEYEALIVGLRIAKQMGVKNLQANVDSYLVANCVSGSYIAKEPGMIQYLEKVKVLSSSFKKFSIKQVPRSENKKANALSKIASTIFSHLTKQALVEELKEKSINKAKVLAVVEEVGDTWMTLIYNYLMEKILLVEKEKARVVRRKSERYVVINEVLYKKYYLGTWLQCVGPLQANYVLREIHEGSCTMHAETRFVVAKAIRTGYYWPTINVDARKLIRGCQDCQGPGKIKFLIVAMDYFTKWIEAKPVVTRTEAVILVEIGMPTIRTAEVDIVQNDEALGINLELLEEMREKAAIRKAKSNAKMEKYYDYKVRNTSFKHGDLVYMSNEASHAKESGKLSPKWEGPYEVTKALGNGAYKLRDHNGKLIPQT